MYKTNFGVSTNPITPPEPGPTTLSYYAAGLCSQTISTYSDWYLPAICELSYSTEPNCGTSTNPSLQNVQMSLGNKLIFGRFWSSTEQSSPPVANPAKNAWLVEFSQSAFGPLARGKWELISTRCSRNMTL